MRRAVAMLATGAWMAGTWPASSLAQPVPGRDTPDDAPAFQGHAAEMHQRDEAVERRRRMLFFDDVEIELGPQGLPCDHVARTKPHAIAGPGYVVLMTLQDAKSYRVRIWFPPPAPNTRSEVLDEARARAADRGARGAIVSHDIQAFLWCR